MLIWNMHNLLVTLIYQNDLLERKLFFFFLVNHTLIWTANPLVDSETHEFPGIEMSMLDL